MHQSSNSDHSIRLWKAVKCLSLISPDILRSTTKGSLCELSALVFFFVFFFVIAQFRNDTGLPLSQGFHQDLYIEVGVRGLGTDLVVF